MEQELVGNKLIIKERLIGSEVFGRSLDYATGDDPVVRVQASEVRVDWTRIKWSDRGQLES